MNPHPLLLFLRFHRSTNLSTTKKVIVSVIVSSLSPIGSAGGTIPTRADRCNTLVPNMTKF